MTRTALLALALLLTGASAAQAQISPDAIPNPMKPYVIAPPFAASDGYLEDEIEIRQGSTLDLYSYDQLPHDVTAEISLWDPETGEIPFQSDAISQTQTLRGEYAPVRGVGTMPVGVYGFFCTIHPQMTGTLTVTP